MNKKYVNNNAYIFSQFEAIKEVVVDHSSSMEILDRWSLLNNRTVISKFNCRIGCVKRSN
jgi:hypothetical protein